MRVDLIATSLDCVLPSIVVTPVFNASISRCIFKIAYDVASLSGDVACVVSSDVRLRFFDLELGVDSVVAVDADDVVDVDGADSCVSCCNNAYFQKLLLLIGRFSLTPLGAF